MTTTNSVEQFLTFRLQNEVYAVPIQSVREINRIGEITKVPHAASDLAGIINLRGKIIPVVDMRLRLGLEAAEYNRDTCIIVCDTENGIVGGIADSVREVTSISPDRIESSPIGSASPNGNNWVSCIAKSEDKVILILDVQKFLSADLPKVMAA